MAVAINVVVVVVAVLLLLLQKFQFFFNKIEKFLSIFQISKNGTEKI